MKSTNQQLRPNILLVHGGTDGSIWIPIIEHLQLQRFNVVASQMPLTSFAQDVKAVERDLGALKGPTVVVGHNYGGLVITQAASRKTNIASLVYVAGCAFDTNETIAGILADYPTPAANFIVPVDRSETPPFLIMQRDKIPEFACPDVIRNEGNAIAATAAPISATIFSAKITKPPAWKQFPTWYLIFSEDQIFHPDAQKKIAKRAAPPERIDSIRASHLGIVSRPLQVARFITQAAEESTAMSHSS
jgi:pimeloyl-ACP methyl ester carboxylesterase